MSKLSAIGFSFLGLFLASAVVAAQVKELPAGWIRAGNKPTEYEMAVDPGAGRSGGAAFIKARTATPTAGGFGTLMQQFAPDEYRGKRVRLSAYVKAAAITDWAGLWMRVDGPASAALAFDNMQDRPIKGTKDWTRYSIVLDVPASAENIAFGILLSGPGQAWLDDIQFEVVGTNVPTTDQIHSRVTAPQNLSFDR